MSPVENDRRFGPDGLPERATMSVAEAWANIEDQIDQRNRKFGEYTVHPAVDIRLADEITPSHVLRWSALEVLLADYKSRLAPAADRRRSADCPGVLRLPSVGGEAWAEFDDLGWDLTAIYTDCDGDRWSWSGQIEDGAPVMVRDDATAPATPTPLGQIVLRRGVECVEGTGRRSGESVNHGLLRTAMVRHAPDPWWDLENLEKDFSWIVGCQIPEASAQQLHAFLEHIGCLVGAPAEGAEIGPVARTPAHAGVFDRSTCTWTDADGRAWNLDPNITYVGRDDRGWWWGGRFEEDGEPTLIRTDLSASRGLRRVDRECGPLEPVTAVAGGAP